MDISSGDKQGGMFLSIFGFQSWCLVRVNRDHTAGLTATRLTANPGVEAFPVIPTQAGSEQLKNCIPVCARMTGSRGRRQRHSDRHIGIPKRQPPNSPFL
jgi:hypothetical protein